MSMNAWSTKSWCSVALALVALACGDAVPPAESAPHSGAHDAAAPAADGGNDAGASDAGALDANAPPPSDDAGDGKPPTRGPLVAYASGYEPNLAVLAVGANGALTPQSTTPAVSSPSFLAIDRAATHLYAVSEETAGRVAAYSIDHATGALTYLNDVSSKGQGPAHLAVDATGQYVIVANYDDGAVAVLPVLAGGKLGDATDTQAAGTFAHMAAIDPTNQFVFVPCKGADYIAQYRFSGGKLIANAVPRVKTKTGAGPRHLAFHPNGKLAYLINENDSTMTAFAFDGTAGQLTPIETKSTLPAGFTGSNTGAEVWVHPSGNWVFGSNRGDDSIVTFAIDPASGKMTLKGHTKTGGKTPRAFTLDPAGAFLYAANQDSNNVVPFRFDAAQGTLTSAGAPVTVQQASFVGIVRLP